MRQLDSTTPTIDAFTVIGPYRDREPGTPYELADLLATHRALGVGGRLCLHAEARDGVPSIANDEVARQAAAVPGTGAIWVALPPRRFGGAPADAFLAYAQAAGVAMAAVLPRGHAHHVAPWAMGDLYAAMEAARLPLVLDLGQVSYDDVHEIATAFPRLPVLVWGASYMDERRQVPLLDLCPNVYVGIASVFIPTGGVERFVDRYGPEVGGRLVFGSSWPLPLRRPDYPREPHRAVASPGPFLAYVRYAAVQVEAHEAILGGTVRRLLADVAWPVLGFGAAGPARGVEMAP